MGTEYTFVCEDCKKYYDIGKDTNAIYLMPVLLREHEGHNILVFSEHEDGLNVKYKGEYSYPCEDVKTDYVEEMVWDKDGLLDKYKDTRYKWNHEGFYNWYNMQPWYEEVRFPRKRYTPEEHAERQERTAKSVQKFYETLDDDMDDN